MQHTGEGAFNSSHPPPPPSFSPLSLCYDWLHGECISETLTGGALDAMDEDYVCHHCLHTHAPFLLEVGHNVGFNAYATF